MSIYSFNDTVSTPRSDSYLYLFSPFVAYFLQCRLCFGLNVMSSFCCIPQILFQHLFFIYIYWHISFFPYISQNTQMLWDHHECDFVQQILMMACDLTHVSADTESLHDHNILWTHPWQHACVHTVIVLTARTKNIHSPHVQRVRGYRWILTWKPGQTFPPFVPWSSFCAALMWNFLQEIRVSSIPCQTALQGYLLHKPSKTIHPLPCSISLHCSFHCWLQFVLQLPVFCLQLLCIAFWFFRQLQIP